MRTFSNLSLWVSPFQKILPLVFVGIVTPAIVRAAVPAEGPITVRTDIPYGNAANVRVQTTGGVSEVRFTPDPHGGPECLWFCFRACRTAGTEPLGQVRVVLECPETMLGGGSPLNFRPVARPAGGDWDRVAPPEIVELPDGRRQAAWKMNIAAASVDMAFAYPYGRPEVERLIRETGGYWHADTIGVSQGGRPLVRLSNDYGCPKGNRPGLYLIARQHSAEVSGSWVLDGVLRRLAKMGDAAPLVWSIPLTNIDGVEQGDYGKDNFPYDLNRAWGKPAMRHETQVFQQDMRRWAQRCRPRGGFDFHAPGASEREGIYAFLHASEKVPAAAEQAKQWAAALAEGLGKDLAVEKFARSGDYGSRWNTPRFGNFCQEDLRIPGVSLEIPYGLIGQTVLTREKYQEAGGRIGEVLGRGIGNIGIR